MNKMAIVHRVGAMLMLFLFPGISWAQEQKVQSVTRFENSYRYSAQ